MTATEDVLALPSVSVAGVAVEHNAASWRVATNRHTNTDGTAWGWIEGAPGNVCWSNNKAFNRDAAGEMVKAHNQWLENQKPLSIRMIEARERWRKAKAEYDSAKSAFDKATDAINKCDEEIWALQSEAKP